MLRWVIHTTWCQQGALSLLVYHSVSQVHDKISIIFYLVWLSQALLASVEYGKLNLGNYKDGIMGSRNIIIAYS